MIARLVIAAPASTAGKTTVATGLLAALARRGLRATGFKVGPDYIDPSYHAIASGRPGRNLDAFLSGPESIAPLFRHGSAGAEVAVVEGVMGLFDGVAGRGELASTAHVAKLLDAPVVLVLDAASSGRSIAAIVHGCVTFDPAVRIAGVVLNRVGGASHAEILRDALAPLDVPVLGAIERSSALATPERHLGLVPVAERARHARETVDSLAAAVEQNCDVDALLAIAHGAAPRPGAGWAPPESPRGEPVRVAVARGAAFSFHYVENVELLRAAGAEVVDVDPLRDEQLPPRTAALLLGGGFPEIYADELSDNWAMRAEICAFARRGGVVVAECAGLIYLAAELDGRPMCDVLPLRGEMADRLALGYREAVAEADHPAWPSRTTVRGHEFHYSRVTPLAEGAAPAWTLSGRGRTWADGAVVDNVHAGYLHTHWVATPDVATRIVAAAAATRGGGATAVAS